MEAATIETLIRDGIPGAHVAVNDLRGDGEHYAVVVTAEAFRGKSRIEQHRMIQTAFKGGLGTELHALQIHTRIPEEEEKK